MKSRGFTHIVIAVLISVMAIGLVGVAWWYELNKNDDALTTYSTKAECESKTGCQCKILLCDYKCPRNFKKGWACNSSAVNTNVNTNSNGNSNTNSVTNGNTNTSDITTGWKTYTNSEYNWTMKYPTNWSVDENTYNDPLDKQTFETPIRGVEFLSPQKDYRLMVGLKKINDPGSIVPRTGFGAGSFEKGETIITDGISMSLWNLVYQKITTEIANYNPEVSSSFVLNGYQFKLYFGCSFNNSTASVQKCDSTDLTKIAEYQTLKTIIGSLVLSN